MRASVKQLLMKTILLAALCIPAIVNAQWTSLPVPGAMGFEKVRVTGPGNVMLLTSFDFDTTLYLLRTNATGTSWDTLRSGLLADFSFPHADTGFVGQQLNSTTAYTYRTHDGGQTWQQAGPLGGRSFQFANARIGYAASSAFYTRKTTDGGATWASLPFNNSGAVEEVVLSGPDTAFVVGWYPGAASRYTAGGLDTAHFYGDAGGFVAATFPTSQVGYAAGYFNAVFKTTNGGATWTSTSAGLATGSYSFRSIYAPDPSRCIVVGDSGRIYSTLDGGATWQYETSGTTRNLRSVHGYSNEVYIVGDSGTVLRKVLPASVPTNPTIPVSLIVQPNPVRRGTTLTVSMPTNAVGKFLLSDASGRKLFATTLPKSGRLEIPTGILTAGTYILTTENDGVRRTARVTVVE